MKKLIFIYSFLIWAHSITFSQTNWFWQNPVPTGEYLNSVKFLTSNIGLAVGDGGEILFSGNGGSSWNLQYSPTTKNLMDIHFHNTITGFITGDSGVILKTNNGGSNWMRLISGTNKHLAGIWCLNSNVSIAIGQSGTIIRTTNGGINWININSGTTNFLRDIFFVNSDTGTIIGDAATILKTTNGGLNWFAQTINPGFYAAITFKDANTGLTVANNNIRKTWDGGNTWTTVSTGANYALADVTFLDSNIAVAVGLGTIGGMTTIMRSSNAGDNWSRVNGSLTYSTLYSICKVDNNSLLAVGNVITKGSTGGLSWISLSSKITSEDFEDVDFADELNGTIVGHNVILRTTNGGNVWFNQNLPGGINDNWLSGVDFVNSNVGAIVGSVDFIYRTTNGGTNWIPQFRDNNNSLSSVHFIDENYGAACGSYETILRTTNGGINWITQRSTTSNNSLSSIYFININTGIAVGNNGNILKTTNGGSNWVQQTSGTTIHLNSVILINALTGYVSGGTGSASGTALILKTVNGGLNWNISLSGNGNLSSIYFIDDKTGYATSWFSSSVFKTTNSGNNWASYSTGTTKYLEDIHFVDPVTGWIVANAGTILKTTNAGIILNTHFVTTSVQKDFMLYQNYPNPFNPRTNLGFGISYLGFVSIKVYDVLGSEISSLVNEKKNSGSYNIEFDGSNLPSGIYFYRLEVDGNSIDTKRMILLK